MAEKSHSTSEFIGHVLFEVTDASALTAGEHTIRAWVIETSTAPPNAWVYSDNACTVNVLEVASVNPNPTKVCVGSEVTFTATGNPSGTLRCVEWQKRYRADSTSAWGSWESVDDSDGGSTTVVEVDTAGQYQVQARNGDGTCASWKESTECTVFDVDITSLATTPYQVGTTNTSASSSMGDDVTINYTISPDGATADSAVLEVRDKNGTLVHSDSTIDKTGGSHAATWSVSTDSLRSVNSEKDPYEVKIKITAGGTTCFGTTSMTVIASTASVVAEDSISECMEGRWVTFTATAIGFVSTITANTIDFTFHYQTASGTPWSETDWSWDLVEDHIAVADDVLGGDPDHFFDTPIYVTVADNFTHTATSSTINIRVYELWIDYFRDNASGKDWKVVVNKNIAYGAIASSDCTNWSWDMADGWPDQWNPTGGDEKVSTTGPSPMVIPKSDLPTDEDWDHFGEAYGTVKVFCEDGEDNNHTFYSTSMSPLRKAKVFFVPGVQTHPGGGTDNWFYYWKYALFSSVANVSWNGALEYGSTSPVSPYAIEIGDSGNADYATAYNHTTLFGYARPTADGKSRIDLFYTVLTHELQHRADAPFLDGVPDADGDRLPDGKDPFPGTINGAGYAEYTGDTAWLGDWEFNARAVENVVAPANKDWSEGGKQW